MGMQAFTIPFSSKQGFELLQACAPELVRQSLFEAFLAQANPFFCGVASLTAVLRASRADWKRRSQDDLLCERASLIRRKTQIMNQEAGSYPGLSIENIHDLAKLHFEKVDLIYGSAMDLPEIHTVLIEALQDDDGYVVANFDAGHLGQDSGGHTANVAALENQSGMVLLLDPAAHKRGWYWARMDALWKAMRIVRVGPGRCRGLVVMRDR